MVYAALKIETETPMLAAQPMRPYLHLCKAGATDTSLNILLVEDDASDVMLTESALDATNMQYKLHTLENGMDVLAYIRRQGQYKEEPKLDVLFLDLTLPKKDGFEVLAELAAKPEIYGDLPIVILTGDESSGFLQISYDLYIVAYLTKPCSPEKIQKAIAKIRKPRQ